jgi:hypothetical protein
MDLPSAITDSVEYPLVLKSRKKNVLVYQLPDLATKDPTPPVECDPCPIEDMSNELIIPSTRPLRVQAHHLEPAPGVHIRIVQFDPPIEEEMTGGFPKIEIFLDIDASVPRVNMDVRAKMAGECFVHVHKPSMHPLTDAGAQHGKDSEEQEGKQYDGEKREQAEWSQKSEQSSPECVLVEGHDPPLSSVGNDSGRVVDKAGCQCSPTCHRGEDSCSAAADTYFGVELGPRSLWD